MELSRNQGRTNQIFVLILFILFFLLLNGIQDGLVISFRKKKEMYLYFQLENILRLFEVMKNDFQEMHIQPDIHDVRQFCY